MTIEEHLTDLDKEGNPIEIKLDGINGFHVIYVDFPVPTKELNFMQFMVMRNRVRMEMMQYVTNNTPPKDPVKAIEALYTKMKEVLTKHYKLFGVL